MTDRIKLEENMFSWDIWQDKTLFLSIDLSDFKEWEQLKAQILQDAEKAENYHIIEAQRNGLSLRVIKLEKESEQNAKIVDEIRKLDMMKVLRFLVILQRKWDEEYKHDDEWKELTKLTVDFSLVPQLIRNETL